MILKDSGVFSPKIDSSQNLVFTIKVKREDHTPAMQQFIFDCYNQWKTLDFEIVWLKEETNELPKLRQRLAMVMQEYKNKSNIDENKLKESLYTKYNIKSRSELTRDQLEECIRFYQDGILYDN